MRRSTRFLLVGIVIELLLCGLTAFLLFSGLSANANVPDSAAKTLQAIGSAMGRISIVITIVWYILRRQENATSVK